MPGKKRILIADDELWYTEPLQDGLKDAGYEVILVTTGAECLRKLEEEKIDLLVLDVMMDPGYELRKEFSSRISGLEIAKRIRKKDVDLPIIILSVVTEPDIVKQFRPLGVRYLRKGETPLRKILAFINSAITGIAYTTEDG